MEGEAVRVYSNNINSLRQQKQLGNFQETQFLTGNQDYGNQFGGGNQDDWKRFGTKLLRKWGWQEGQGLGARLQGIANPIPLSVKRTREGIRSLHETQSQSQSQTHTQNHTVHHEHTQIQHRQKRRKISENASRDDESRDDSDMTDPSDDDVGVVDHLLLEQMALVEQKLRMEREMARAHLQEEKERMEEERLAIAKTLHIQIRHEIEEESKKTKFFMNNFAHDGILPFSEQQQTSPDIEVIENFWGTSEMDLSDPVIRIEHVGAVVHKCISLSNENALSWGTLCTALKFIRQSTSEIEYSSCGLPLLSFILALPLICHKVSTWGISQVLADGSLSLKQCRKRLKEHVSDVTTWSSFLKSNVNFHTHSIWSFIMEQIVGNEVKRWIVEEWKPGNNDDRCAELLDCWYDHLNLDGIIDSHVVENLVKFVDTQWNPCQDGTAKILFLQNWFQLNFVNEEPVVAALYSKLVPILSSDWTPMDPSVRIFLMQLQNISTLLLEQLIDKFVLARLSNFVGESVIVNPADQDLKPLLAFISWRDLVRDSAVLDILEEQFFPQWLQVLDHWLRGIDAESLDEIGTWYTGWKQLFESFDMMYPSVILQFDRALHMIHVELQLPV